MDEKAVENKDNVAVLNVPPPAPDQPVHDETTIRTLNERIDKFQKEIPDLLRERPDIQTRCLDLLEEAAKLLIPPVTPISIIQCKSKLALVEIELVRADTGRMSLRRRACRSITPSPAGPSTAIGGSSTPG